MLVNTPVFLSLLGWARRGAGCDQVCLGSGGWGWGSFLSLSCSTYWPVVVPGLPGMGCREGLMGGVGTFSRILASAVLNLNQRSSVQVLPPRAPLLSMGMGNLTPQAVLGHSPFTRATGWFAHNAIRCLLSVVLVFQPKPPFSLPPCPVSHHHYPRGAIRVVCWEVAPVRTGADEMAKVGRDFFILPIL